MRNTAFDLNKLDKHRLANPLTRTQSTTKVKISGASLIPQQFRNQIKHNSSLPSKDSQPYVPSPLSVLTDLLPACLCIWHCTVQGPAQTSGNVTGLSLLGRVFGYLIPCRPFWTREGLTRQDKNTIRCCHVTEGLLLGEFSLGECSSVCVWGDFNRELHTCTHE